MPKRNYGENVFTAEEIDELFAGDEDEQETPPAEDGSNSTDEQDNHQSENPDVTKTQAFAKRLRESTDKARNEERELIAKSLGFESYAKLQEAQENKLYEDKGFTKEEVSPLVDELVKQKLGSDPRMQELEALRKAKVQEFGKQELAEITELTGGEITKFSQLPKEVIDLWKSTGSLKNAYMQLEGVKLVTRLKSEQNKGSTQHMQQPTGNSVTKTTERHLSDEEKRMWKFFNPNVSDEELNNKLISK